MARANATLPQIRHLLKVSPEKWVEIAAHSQPQSPKLYSPLPQIRHLLKMSPEKWEEIAAHALAAVVPDFRQRAWWCPSMNAGLLFSTKNGSVCMEQPTGGVGGTSVLGHRGWIDGHGAAHRWD